MLCLLGQPCVREGDVLTPLKLRPKATALLVRLALESPVARVALADLLFPEAESPRAALRWHLSYLKDRLPDSVRAHLSVTADQASLDIPTDAAVFEAEARRVCEQPDAAEAGSILALYRGDLCAGLTVSTSATFDTWLYMRQERLRRAFRQATVAFARHELEAAQPAAAIAPLAELIAVDPYHEDAHILFIEATEALGRPTAAAAAFQRYQRILRRELQTEPPRYLVERYQPGAAS